jgi:transposase
MNLHAPDVNCFAFQRFGSISKQGNRFLRMLLVEAAQNAVRYDPQMRSEYLHRCHRKAKGVAKVAAARKLAIRLYWMLRTKRGYPEVVRVESSSRVPLVSTPLEKTSRGIKGH